MKLTVAKERPEVPDVTTGNPTVEEATQTLEEAGFKVATDRAPRSGARRARDRPAAGGRHARARPAGRSRSSSCRGRDAASGADPDAMRVAVLAGGRSSEHDVSLRLRGIRARGRRRGRPRGAGGDDRALGRVGVRRRARGPAPRRRPARRRRGVRRAARAVRRGRDAPGAAGAARRALRRRRRARLVAVHGQGGVQGGAGRRRRPAGALRGRARAALARGARCRRGASWPCSARPCSSSRRGSARRSGSPR